MFLEAFTTPGVVVTPMVMAWLRRVPTFAVLLIAALGLAACASNEPGADDASEEIPEEGLTETTDPPDQMPDWLESVEPIPDNQLSGEAIVVVHLNFETANRVARLTLDGIDVTAASTEPADTSAIPERLVYDPDGMESPPVNLDPGLHLATVRLLHYPEGFEAGDFEVEGSFTWSFEIL